METNQRYPSELNKLLSENRDSKDRSIAHDPTYRNYAYEKAGVYNYKIDSNRLLGGRKISIEENDNTEKQDTKSSSGFENLTAKRKN